MRVLQINATYGIGSTGVIVKDIHELCLNSGFESYVTYSKTNIAQNEIKNGYKIGSVFGKKLHALFCRINGMQSYFSRFSTKKLIKKLQSIKPDIVQLHNLHSNYINLPMLLKYLAKAKIKTVVTLHDCWFFTGGCFHYTATGCENWKKTCGNCPKKLSDTPAYMFDRSRKILNDRYKLFGAIENLTVVGVSEWITKESVKSVFKGRDAVTIHNGVDTDVFKETASDFREKHNLGDRFVVLGPASKWLLPINKQIFEYMLSNLDSNDAFVLFGCSEEQLKSLPRNVIGLPFIRDKQELCRIYSAADVYVNTTREDALSFANLEPQACGTPVITFGNTGAKETVDGYCGFAVSETDYSELVEKIKFVKEKGKSYFSDKCRCWIEDNFSRNRNYEKYLQLYKMKEI